MGISAGSFRSKGNYSFTGNIRGYNKNSGHEAIPA